VLDRIPQALRPRLTEVCVFDDASGDSTFLVGQGYEVTHDWPTLKIMLRGGLPLYKWVGNQILTRFENAALGMELTEFHSGYRAYAVQALARLLFEANSDDFHFDTQIIIQLHAAGLRIREVPIPTYYGALAGAVRLPDYSAGGGGVGALPGGTAVALDNASARTNFVRSRSSTCSRDTSR
jgi:hypothetical protein